MIAPRKKGSPRETDPDSNERLRKRVSELLADHADAKDRIAELEAELKADRAECFYWKAEAELLRNDLVAQLRESALKKPWGEES